MTAALARWEELLASTPARLLEISDDAASEQPDPNRWSKKQLLGHLIDSAANNHQRFVRAQFTTPVETPGYEQELWVTCQSYATEPWTDLVNLWLLLNRHLLHIVKVMPAAALANQCIIADRPGVTLELVIIDYVLHLDQHLAQL